MEFDIEYWIKELNAKVPIRYFKRNASQFRLVTYVNHSIILFKGNHFDSSFMFIKRSYVFLEQKKQIEIDSEYLKTVSEYLLELYNYLIDNNLVRKELILRFDTKI